MTEDVVHTRGVEPQRVQVGKQTISFHQARLHHSLPVREIAHALITAAKDIGETYVCFATVRPRAAPLR